MKFLKYKNLSYSLFALKKTPLQYGAACFLALLLVACSGRSPDLRDRVENNDEGAVFSQRQEAIPSQDKEVSVKIKKAKTLEKNIMVALPEALNVERDVAMASMLALNHLGDKSIRVLLQKEFGNKSDYGNLLAILGPFNSLDTKKLRDNKPKDSVAFALTNDSEAGGSGVLVAGLTPENQARFIAPYLPRIGKSDSKPLNFILDDIGYKANTNESEFEVAPAVGITNQSNQSKKLSDLIAEVEKKVTLYNEHLPIVIFGREGDLFYKRFVSQLKESLSPLVNSATFQVSLDIIEVELPEDRNDWSPIISSVLRYQERAKDFKAKLALAPDDVRKLFENSEILDPPSLGAAIIVLHNEVDVRWLASLISYYDNSWQKIPVFGLESWSKYKSLIKERSLKGAFIPTVGNNVSLTKKLDELFFGYFGRSPTKVTKFTYDFILFVQDVFDKAGEVTLEAISSMGRFAGWSGNYRVTSAGNIEADLIMAKVSSSGLKAAEPLALKPYRIPLNFPVDDGQGDLPLGYNQDKINN